ncbi:MAG: hypothetical protein ACREJ2_13115 [Planctomycetota bacterium]
MGSNGTTAGARPARRTAEPREQSKAAARLDMAIWANLKELGYG